MYVVVAVISYYMILYCIVLYLYHIVSDCIVSYCIVSYCTVLYCIVLYCSVMYCSILYYVKRIIVTLNSIKWNYLSITISVSVPLKLRSTATHSVSSLVNVCIWKIFRVFFLVTGRLLWRSLLIKRKCSGN